jgi:hypothetical protein
MAFDMVVACRSRGDAAGVPVKLREWMPGTGLTLDPEWTRLVDMVQPTV